METSAILLHDVTCNYVFEWFVKLRQMIKAVLHYVGGPLVDLRLLVSVSSNCVLDGILYDGADLSVLEIR